MDCGRRTSNGAGLIRGRTFGFPMCLLCAMLVSGPARCDVEMFVQLGHLKSIAAATISADGRYALTSADDDTIKVWDLTGGRVIRTFRGHVDRPSVVAVSPDGGQAVSWASSMHTQAKHIIGWDVGTGRELRQYPTREIITSAVFLPDGRHFATGATDMQDFPNYLYSVHIWEFRSGRRVKTLRGHRKDVGCLAVGQQGRILVSGSRDGAVMAWDLQSGRRIRTLSGHSTDVCSVAVSPDGRYAVSGDRKGNVFLWDLGSGRKQVLALDKKRWVQDVVFTADSKRVLMADFDGKVWVWELDPISVTGAVLIKKGQFHTGEVAFGPGGQSVLFAHQAEVSLWNPLSGTRNWSFLRRANGVQKVAFAPDGGCGISRPWGQVCFWDLSSGRRRRGFLANVSDERMHDISRDGRYAFSVRQEKRMWELTTGVERSVAEIREWHDVSPDGRSALYYSTKRSGSSSVDNKRISVYDLATGREVTRLRQAHKDVVRPALFTPSGRRVLTGTALDPMRLFDARSGRLLRAYPGAVNPRAAAVSQDERIAVCGGRYDRPHIEVWDLVRGRPMGCLQGTYFRVDGWWLKGYRFPVAHDHGTAALAVSGDGRYALSGGEDWIVKLWDLGKGQEVRAFLGHEARVTSVAFSADGRQILSGSEDASARLWDATTGAELARFIAFNDGEWITMTPDGYYTCSPEGDKHINVSSGMDVYGIKQYRASFLNPDLIEARLSGGVAGVAPERGGWQGPSSIQQIANFPPPVVVIVSPSHGASVAAADVQVNVVVKSEKPVKTFELFVNGQSVLPPAERGLKATQDAGQDKITRTFSIPLDYGENRVLVRCRAAHASGEDTIVLSRTGAGKEGPVLPRLFLLAVGVGDYPALAPGDRLDYPPKDARTFAKAFQLMEGPLFREVKLRVLADDTEQAPTADNIEDNLEFLAQASQHDVAILFLAGHGIRDGDGRYYFLPRDAERKPNGKFRASKLVRWSSITEALDIPSRTLAFIDTCHAGALFKSGKTRGVDSEWLIRGLLEQGTIVFAASTGRELSQESEQWGHGAFTVCLLQGLREKKANLVRDEYITMKELDTFVSAEVVKLTGGSQHPVSYAPEGYKDFALWLVE